jgi:hypothetical protein
MKYLILILLASCSTVDDKFNNPNYVCTAWEVHKSVGAGFNGRIKLPYYKKERLCLEGYYKGIK